MTLEKGITQKVAVHRTLFVLKTSLSFDLWSPSLLMQLCDQSSATGWWISAAEPSHWHLELIPCIFEGDEVPVTKLLQELLESHRSDMALDIWHSAPIMELLGCTAIQVLHEVCHGCCLSKKALPANVYKTVWINITCNKHQWWTEQFESFGPETNSLPRSPCQHCVPWPAQNTRGEKKNLSTTTSK